MARKVFNPNWIGVYRSDINRYYGGNHPVRAGGSRGYQTFIGVPSSVKDALTSSKTTSRLIIRFYVRDGGYVSLGGHRESYNKASGTLPWYKYLGRELNPATGWREYDITSQLKSELLKGSLRGLVMYYPSSSNYFQADGRGQGSTSFQWIVEGTWNTAPKPPKSFIEPKSSSVIDDHLTVSWEAGSDNESSASQLRYELQYYNGSSWGSGITTGAGTTYFNARLRNSPETSRARYRVRTVDPEGLKSDWLYSPYFTVAHNIPPSKPTNLTPTGGKRIDRESTLRATWKHNDDGAQAGYRLAWRVVAPDGTQGTWNYIPSSSGWVNSTSEYHDFPAGTFPLSEIEWTVKTKDQQGEESPYANYERFYAGEISDAPIWLSPTSGAVINSSELIANWSSIDQIEYEIEFYEGSTLLWREHRIASNKSTRVGYALENNKTYRIRIRAVNETSQLWSEWSEITFTTQFIPPAKPIITVETTSYDGTNMDTIIVNWDTDSPATETPTDIVQVFRREYNSSVEQPWLLIGDNQAPNSSMVDYTPASNQVYEYKVRAWGSNDTYSDSDIVEAEIVLSHSFLHRAKQPSDLLVLDIEERSQDFDFGGNMMTFANRVKPVFEHGINEIMSLPIKFSIMTPQDLRSVMNFIRRRETFLYRDTSGRRFFCVVRRPTVTDKPVNGFEMELILEEVDSDDIIQGG